MSKLWAAAAGVLFGVGLMLSGMTKPSKVLGFLDVTGAWDPSLAFVMMGAIAVHALGYRVVRRRATPRFDTSFHVPPARAVDAPLLLGAALFGIGWGLGGFCPGPVLVTLASGSARALIFVAAMIAGVCARWGTSGQMRSSPENSRNLE